MATTIQLILGHRTFYAGSPVSGAVALDFRLIQKEGVESVHIRMTGHYHSEQRNGDNSIASHSFTFMKCLKPVWTRGEVYPPPDSDILTLPWEIPLLQDMPPTFSAYVRNCHVSVKYSLHVIGSRPGLFKLNTEIKRNLIIFPNASASVPVQTQLNYGWDGPWRAVAARDRLSKFIFWGRDIDTDITIHFIVPDIDTVPVYTLIPFTIIVTTLSHPLPQEYDGKLWPNLPCLEEAFAFILRENIVFKINHTQQVSRDRRQQMGGAEFEEKDREWIPSKDGLGRWKRKMTLKSNLRLQCPPTFVWKQEGKVRLAVSYDLCVKVRFGSRRLVSLKMPITIVRNVAAR